MQLTPHQEGLIAGYIREVSLLVDGTIPAPDKERCARRLEEQLRERLARLAGDEVQDEDVQAAIRALGSAESQARKFTAPKGPEGDLVRAAENRVWLGVCAGIAHRTGIEVWVVRALAIVAGVFLAPLAMLGYLAGYAELYISTGKQLGAPPNLLRMGGRAVAAIVVAILLYVGTDYLLAGLAYGYEVALNRPLPNLGQWGWYYRRADVWLFWAMVFSAPVAALSGAPLAHGWDYSLKRLAQAILALYAVAICFGVAGILVGVILDVIGEFGGIPLEMPFG